MHNTGATACNAGGDLNFRVSVPMEKGATRYIGVKHSGGKSGLFYLNISIECTDTEISSRLRNIGTLLYYVSSSINGKRLKETALRQYINDGHVVYVARGRYQQSARAKGHAILVVGYTTTFNNGQLKYRYTINDPWPNSMPYPWDLPETTNGQSYERSYAWICNSEKGDTGEPVEQGVWDGFVTVFTEYADETLAPDTN